MKQYIMSGCKCIVDKVPKTKILRGCQIKICGKCGYYNGNYSIKK